MTEPTPLGTRSAPRRRLPWTKRVVILLCLVSGWLGWVVLSDRIVVSPETTYITAPLGADGLPDYERYWAEQQSAGVTRENNAAVLLFQVTPPEFVAEQDREVIYHSLGIEPPEPANSIKLDLKPYFASQELNRDAWIKLQQEIYFGPEAVTIAKYPELAKWLDDNSRPMQIVEAASLRERFDCGLPLGPPRMDGWPADHFTIPYTVWTRPFKARLRLRLGEGDLAGACADAITLMRLTHLAADSGLMSETVIYNDLRGFSYTGLPPHFPPAQVALDPRLSLEQVQRFRKQLQNLPRIATLERAIQSERLIWLNYVVHPDQQGFPDDLARPGRDVRTNRALRNLNRWHEDLLRIERMPDVRKRAVAYFDLTQAKPDKVSPLTRSIRWLQNWLRKPPPATAKTFDEIDFFRISYASQIYHGFQVNLDEIAILQQLTELGAAIAEHRARIGALPASLEQLVPNELSAVPIDPWTGQPFKYVTREGKFAVSSPVMNGLIINGTAWHRDDIVFGDLHLAPPEPAAP